jgi:hypothetical protein
LYRPADTDTTTVSALALAWITMNPTVAFMADGDLATMWRRFAEATIVEQAAAVRMLIDPRPLPARHRLFRRMVVAVAAVVAVVAVAVAVGDAESFANKARSH